MPTSFVCPFCDSETPADKKFCKKCGKGLQCPNTECRAPIEVDADFCVECGQAYRGESLPLLTNSVNQLDYYSNQHGRTSVVRAQIRFSDQAIIAAAPYVFDQLIANQVIQAKPHIPQIAGKSISLTPTTDQGDLFSQDAEFHEEPSQPDVAITTAVINVKAPEALINASSHFVRDGDVLVAKTPDFKGTSLAEQQRNFVVVYASAYTHIMGKVVPSKESFTTAAIKAGLYDKANFRKQVEKQRSAFLMQIDGGFRLNSNGESEVARILTLMSKPDAAAGYDYWKRDASNKTERQRLSDKDKKTIDGWATEEVDIGEIEVRNIKTAHDYAVFTYWLITIKLKKKQAVHRQEAFYYLKKKYETVSVTPEAFSKAVLRDDKELHFRKSDYNHYLTPEAISLVDGWCSGSPIESGKPLKKETSI